MHAWEQSQKHHEVMQKNHDSNQKHFIPDAYKCLKYDYNHLQQWLLYSPSGREILRSERLFFSQNVDHIFGNYSLQIGLNNINFLQGNKILNHYTLNLDLQADLRFLPFASDSFNLIVCPHVLEFTNNYHHLLQELYRIMAPGGKVIFTCFNRYSWFGLCQRFMPVLQAAQLINLSKIKSQLETLNFSLEGGKFYSYCPPFSNRQRLSRFQWMNKIGDRWFPTLANSFALIARKDIITPSLIKAKDLEIFKSLGTNLGTAKICHKN